MNFSESTTHFARGKKKKKILQCLFYPQKLVIIYHGIEDKCKNPYKFVNSQNLRSWKEEFSCNSETI